MLSILFSLIVSTSQANNIKNLIVNEATRQGLEPQIALAVVSVESNFNPRAVGKRGEIGLFQLHPHFVKNAKFTVKDNIRLGIEHLLYFRQNCPTQRAYTWITCYNNGLRNPKYPELLPYYLKVIKAMREYEGAQ